MGDQVACEGTVDQLALLAFVRSVRTGSRACTFFPGNDLERNIA